MLDECRMCDGTGSLCPTCGDSAHGCPCKGVIIVDTCPACDGTGDMSDDDMSAQNDESEKAERYGASK